ncbi:MAG: SDR family NAD(P)-dependent oxidoreductase, partial [Chloroflexi bacterium]|nr:SDR family NAD(P)-dependent oxidoreductase [Chloroflexota bacterium]
GGDVLTEWGTPFWELDMHKGLTMLERAIHSHIITSRYGVPLMLERDQGLVIEITDGDTLNYRGNLFYDLVKTSVIRLAQGMAEELKGRNITALALTPGFLRSEEMLDHFGVTEANWRDGVKTDPHFIASETPTYIGRAVVALASDPNVARFAGQSLATWTLMHEYNFTDADGTQPDWGTYFETIVKPTFPEQKDCRNSGNSRILGPHCSLDLGTKELGNSGNSGNLGTLGTPWELWELWELGNSGMKMVNS